MVLNRFRIFILLPLLVMAIGCSKVQGLAENVESASLRLVTTNLLPAVIGQAYFYQISASGGTEPFVYSILSGTLPNGLSMDAAGGLSGTPGVGSTGTYNFTVQVIDGKSTAVSKVLTLIVSQALNITTSSLDLAQQGNSYADSMSASGGSGIFTWSATGLPVGLSISASGVISGIPIVSGASTVTFTVVDSNGLTNSKDLTLNVTTTPSISTASLASAKAGSAYSVALVGAGGEAPYTFSITSGSLPVGITMSSAGLISGTATYGANVRNSPFSVTFQIRDNLNQTATRTLALPVNLAPGISDDKQYTFRRAVVGTAYTEQLKVLGGKSPLAISAAGLPSGLSVNSSTGRISGTPSVGTAGTYTVNFTVTDGNSLSSTMSKKLYVGTGALNGDSNAGYMTPVGWYNSNWAYPAQLQIADLNNDGKNDIVYGATASQVLIVMLGDGAGNYTKYSFLAGGQIWGVRVADMDADGKLDVVTSLVTSNMTIFKGDNLWTGAITTQSIALANDPMGFVLTDVNADARPDIVVARWNANVISVLLNCGSGVTTVPYNGNPTQACSSTGQAITNFHAAATVATGANPRGVVIGDMSGDGKVDMVFSSYNASTISIALGNANGTFAAPTTTAIANPRQVAMLDMNADGRLDVISTTNTGVTVLLGNGTGGFSSILSGTITDVGGTPEYFDVKDMNGDTFPDVVMTLQATHLNQIAMFYGDGSGQLTNRRLGSTSYSAIGIAAAPMFTTSTRPDLVYSAGAWVGLSRVVTLKNSDTSTGFDLPQTFRVNPPNADGAIFGAPVIGDINEDGYQDIINKLGGVFSILFGNTSGYSLSATTVPTGEAGATYWFGHQAMMTDLNLDNHLDLVSANWNSGGTGTITALMGVGDGSFSSQTNFATNASGCTSNLGTRSVDFGDVNRDGYPDAIIGTGCSVSPGAQVYIYFGYGDGSFNLASPRILAGPGSYVDVARAVDVDGDGNLDIVIASNSAQIQVYKGNGDGTFAGVAPSAGLGIASNISTLQSGDFNNDGFVDFAACSVSGPTIAIAMMGAGITISSVNGIVGNVLSNDYNNQACTGLIITDWNQDGKLDILARKGFNNGTNNAGGGGIHVYYGNGNGTFTVRGAPMSEPNSGSYSDGALATIDIDGDGKHDIVIATYSNSYNVGTILNKSQ